jgi:hypothetical protein
MVRAVDEGDALALEVLMSKRRAVDARSRKLATPDLFLMTWATQRIKL